MKLEDFEVGTYVLYDTHSSTGVWLSKAERKVANSIYLINLYCSTANLNKDGICNYVDLSDFYEWTLLKVYKEPPKEFLI